MKEITQMILVLAVISAVCGAALSGLRNATAERIENQILINVQGPKVKKVLAGAENDCIADRRKLKVDGQDITVYIGKKQGNVWAVAYETTGKGFGGNLTVMAGFDLGMNNLTGMQVVTHRETPGIGSKVTEDQFTGRFKGLHLELTDFPPSECPSKVDAISGATYSSTGVCEALRKSLALYPGVRKELLSTK